MHGWMARWIQRLIMLWSGMGRVFLWMAGAKSCDAMVIWWIEGGWRYMAFIVVFERDEGEGELELGNNY